MHVSEAGPDPVMIGAMKYIWKALIEPWGKSLDYQATMMTECGNIPLGFTKQNVSGSLEIDSSKAVVDELMKAGLTLEKICEHVGFSKTALTKAWMDQFKVGETTASRKVEMLLTAANLAHRGDATFKLIRNKDAENDIRAALARGTQPALT
jgi:hypothetical protein